MRLLISNDDGIDAPGIRALIEALEPDHEVWVVAPDGQRSAQSHALTLHAPLRVERRAERRFAISGTPADSIYLALHSLMPEPPQLVLSGINHGANLGSDVHYSGTVAAAREAALRGVPAVALSLYLEPGAPVLHWDTAVGVARTLVGHPAVLKMPAQALLNVNIPNVPSVAMRGMRAATLGVRNYDSRVVQRQDPWGRTYYWIGGDHVDFDEIEGSDGTLVEAGYSALTPLHCDPTLHRFVGQIEDWFDGR